MGKGGGDKEGSKDLARGEVARKVAVAQHIDHLGAVGAHRAEEVAVDVPHGRGQHGLLTVRGRRIRRE